MRIHDLLSEAEISDLGPMNDKMRDMLSKVKADDEAHAQAVADKKEKDRQARAAAMGEKGMQDYIQKLKAHDWYYNYSDDHNEWSKGASERNEIRRLQQILDPDFDIYNKYAPKDFKIKVSVKETTMTTASSIAVVVNPTTAKAKVKRDKTGVPKAPQKTNPDGTAKNALDLDNNLMGGKTIKR